MSNATWACFDCRSTLRRVRYTTTVVLCQSCGQPCRYMGHKIRMPAKRQTKAWLDLRNAIQVERISSSSRRISRRKDIEDEIAQLKAKGLNAASTNRIRQLRGQLSEL